LRAKTRKKSTETRQQVSTQSITDGKRGVIEDSFENEKSRGIEISKKSDLTGGGIDQDTALRETKVEEN